MPRIALVCLSGLLVFSAAAAEAQEAVLAELYGNGVHAFFAGDVKDAHEYFNTVAEGDSRDPRVFLFRGLTFLQLGRPEEAQADFATGAALELGDTDGFYNVSRAIRRVQGQPRLMIEEARAQARVQAAKQQVQERNQRYNRILQREPAVVEPSSDGADPFSPNLPAPDGNAKPATPPMPQPATPTTQPMPKPVTPQPPAGNPFQPAGDAPPTAGPSGGASSTQAVGNVLQKIFGGLVPDEPPVPLPFGGGAGEEPPQIQPQPGEANPFQNDNPFQNPSPAPGNPPQDSSEDNPFE